MPIATPEASESLRRGRTISMTRVLAGMRELLDPRVEGLDARMPSQRQADKVETFLRRVFGGLAEDTACFDGRT
jgi:hypothetical protein